MPLRIWAPATRGSMTRTRTRRAPRIEIMPVGKARPVPRQALLYGRPRNDLGGGCRFRHCRVFVRFAAPTGTMVIRRAVLARTRARCMEHQRLTPLRGAFVAERPTQPMKA